MNVDSVGRSIHNTIGNIIVPSITRENKLTKDPIPNFNVVREGRSIQYIYSF